jgi:hypothetical protein
MKSFRFLTGLAVLIVLVSGASAAREGKGKRAKEPTKSVCETMVEELKISGDQKAQLEAKFKAVEEAGAAWDKANAEKTKAAEEAAAAAKGGDADAKKTASTARRELSSARAEALTDAVAAVVTVLTDEQKAAWAGYTLYETTVKRYRKTEFTEDQLAKIKAASAIAAKQQAVEEAEGTKKKKGGSVTDKLKWAIEAVIMTPEQREAIPAKGARGKKDAPETPVSNTNE